MCELYGKLRTNKGYSRHPGSLYRIYRKLGYSSYAPSTKKKRKPQPYDTPTELGIKWQMDVEYSLMKVEREAMQSVELF